jgi:putative hydrolase of the HAD superfamily
VRPGIARKQANHLRGNRTGDDRMTDNRVMPVAAVVFDFFGTLTPSTPEHVWVEHARRSAVPLGIGITAWRRALDGSFAERVTGALGDLPATFRELARRCGVQPADDVIAEACAARMSAQRELFTLRSDARAVLAEIRWRGLPVGVLSDCTLELAQCWPDLEVASMVDTRVLSCEVGRRKPDPELFRMIARGLGVDPADCLYLGDGGGSELSGAAACGMRAVMLRAEDWPANIANGREDDWPGPWVPSLSAVLAWLPMSNGERLPAVDPIVRNATNGARPAGAAAPGTAGPRPILRQVPTTPTMKRRGRPPRHNRSEILDAASEVMIFRGYGATRYSDVAEVSGVPVASLQHHFPTLGVLRREALRNKVRAELTALTEQVDKIDDPWERIYHILVTSVSLDPARRRGGWVLWLEYYRAAAHDDELAEDMRDVTRQWLSLIAECVSDGAKAGVFRLDATPYEVALELHGVLDGLGVRLAIEHPPEDAAQAIAVLERAARRMLFRPV